MACMHRAAGVMRRRRRRRTAPLPRGGGGGGCVCCATLEESLEPREGPDGFSSTTATDVKLVPLHIKRVGHQR